MTGFPEKDVVEIASKSATHQSQHPESSRIAAEPEAQDRSRAHLGGQPRQNGQSRHPPVAHAAYHGGAADDGGQGDELHGSNEQLDGVQDGHLGGGHSGVGREGGRESRNSCALVTRPMAKRVGGSFCTQ